MPCPFFSLKYVSGMFRGFWACAPFPFSVLALSLKRTSWLSVPHSTPLALQTRDPLILCQGKIGDPPSPHTTRAILTPLGSGGTPCSKKTSSPAPRGRSNRIRPTQRRRSTETGTPSLSACLALECEGSLDACGRVLRESLNTPNEHAEALWEGRA